MKVGEKYKLKCFPDYGLFGLKEFKELVVEVSYIRSGVVFIVWDGKEEGFYIDSPLARRLKKIDED